MMDGIERPKRRKHDSKNKAGAFEKLKQLKSSGVKHKYEIQPIEDVYEEITEKEYTEKVLQRQQDCWIVDDNLVDGYVEDGREIFDDDIDNESIQRKTNGSSCKKRDHLGNSKGNNNIQKMFSKMPTKKKPVAAAEDNILGNLMKELDTPESTKVSTIPNKSINELDTSSENLFKEYDSLAADSYIKKFSSDDVSINSINISHPCVEPSEVYEVVQSLKDTTRICETTADSLIDIDVNDFNDNDFEVDAGNASTVNGNIHESKATIGPKVDVVRNAENIVFSEKMEDSVTSNETFSETETSFPVVCESGNIASSESIKFFYWDAYEDNNQPGVVFLFGKVWIESSKMFVSCCIVVKNIDRCVYLLPKEGTNSGHVVTILDVYKEFSDKVATRRKITQFKTRKVTKKYAFDIAEVPEVCDYLEVRYSALLPPLLQSDLKGETYSRVFGSSSSFLELFLLERKIKGPCWLEIRNFQQISNGGVSWCKLEISCANAADISVINDPSPPPPMTVMAIKLQTVLSNKMNDNQIAIISVAVTNNYSINKPSKSLNFDQQFCTYTRPSDVSWPYDLNDALKKHQSSNLIKMDSERSMLGFFLAKLYKIDPDLIIGHDIYGFDIGTLLHRLISNKIAHWSRLGRIRRNHMPIGKVGFERNVMCGRLVCDIKISAMELIKARSYDLDTLRQQVLNVANVEEQRSNLSGVEIKNAYTSSGSLIQLLNITARQVRDIYQITHELNVLPLSLQITNIAGNVLSRTLTGGRSERNEFLLLHAFYAKDYILPDKVYPWRKQNNPHDPEFEDNKEARIKVVKRKAQYEGGLVLEPKKGFYDTYVLLMDFNSLYPSIIQEYNICFTTIPIRLLTFAEGEELTLLNHISSTQPGVLPSEIRKLVESRRDIKRMMQNPDISSDIRFQYNIRQLALKLTANSMYGCLGFTNSRFYAKPLAALITGKGREILINTRDLVRKLNYDVIYGDTDSLMINTNCVDFDQVTKIGQKIKYEVNKTYKQIELEIDGVFKYMLLLKKKKYAAVTISKDQKGEMRTKQEIKGLDIIRRDWSRLSAEIGQHIVSLILSDLTLDDKIQKINTRLLNIKTDLEASVVPLSLLTITKQLNKNPEDYPDKKSLPHVQVAFRLNNNKSCSKKLKKGDVVPYVICENGTNLPATQRAYHLNELNGNDELKIDIKYYLSQQIHPVVSRLCEPISGIDSIQIAETLGLDTSAYVHKNSNVDNQTLDEGVSLNSEDRFVNCEPLQFYCLNENCNYLNTINSPTLKKGNGIVMSLERCLNEKCEVILIQYLPHIQNHLTLSIRSHIQKYYASRLICEDSSCNNNTRRLFLRSDVTCNVCRKNRLHRQYNENQLHNQILYFKYLFDITQAMLTNRSLKINHESDILLAYCRLNDQIDNVLKHSAYRILNLGKMCQVIRPKIDNGSLK